MGADNYSDCPRCHLKKVAAHEKAGADLHAQYGKVDALSWAQAKKAYDETSPPEFRCADGEGLREDYEFFLNELGQLNICYNGWCQDCGFGTDYERVIQIPGMPKE